MMCLIRTAHPRLILNLILQKSSRPLSALLHLPSAVHGAEQVGKNCTLRLVGNPIVIENGTEDCLVI